MKAASILAVGVQPPVVYELAQLLFALGLLGLYALIPRPARAARIGLGLAVLAAVSGAGLVAGGLEGEATIDGPEFVLPWSVMYLLLGPGSMLAAVLLGGAVAASGARTGAGAGRRVWRSTPFVVAVLPVPFMVTVLIHVEVPVLLIGLSWVLLAGWLWGEGGGSRWGTSSPGSLDTSELGR